MYVKKAIKAGNSSRVGRADVELLRDERCFHEKSRCNASRDMHSRFARLGLSMPVNIERVEHPLQNGKTTTHWIKPSEWVKVLMNKAPYALVGQCQDRSLQLRSFWAAYEQNNPQHVVFQHHANDLHQVLPLALFGDEGRGPKRDKFLVWSVECLLGLQDMKDFACCCASEVSKMEAAGIDTCRADGVMTPLPPDLLHRVALQSTNYKGHSYVTRHMLFGWPACLYRDPEVLDKHLKLLSNDMISLFWDGVTLKSGEQIFGALCAVKGDMKHMVQIGITRSYHKLRGGMMCSLCEAGAANFGLPAFEDTRDEPDWAATMGVSRPWETPPELSRVPYNPVAPELAFALDVFHVFKVGIARDLIGSMIVTMAKLQFFATGLS